MVRRSYEEFRTLDAHLHQCIYDRRYSQLLPLPAIHEIGDRLEVRQRHGFACTPAFVLFTNSTNTEKHALIMSLVLFFEGGCFPFLFYADVFVVVVPL